MGWLGTVALGALAIVDVTPTTALPLVALGATVLAAAPSWRLAAASGRRRSLVAAGGVGLAATSTSAAIVLAGTDGVAVVLPVLAGLVAAAAWWRVTGPIVGIAAATGGLTALAVGGVATFDLAIEPAMAMVAGVGLVVAGLGRLVPADRRAVLAGSLPASLPAAAAMLAISIVAAVGWFEQTSSPWRPSGLAVADADPWLAGLALAATGMLVLVGGVLAPRQWRNVDRSRGARGCVHRDLVVGRVPPAAGPARDGRGAGRVHAAR